MFGLFKKRQDTIRRDEPLADIFELFRQIQKLAPPSPAELEQAYIESDLVYSAIQEIIAGITRCRIEANIAIRTLFEHPNHLQDFSQFISQWLAAYLTTGAAYVLKLPLGSGAIQELRVLRTSGVSISYGTFDAPYRKISYSDNLGQIKRILPENLIIRINPSPLGPLEPASPLLACWSVIQTDMLRQRYQRESLRRLPFLVGVVETETATTKTQRDTLAQSLEQILGGATLVLPNGTHIVAPGIVRDITLPGLSDLAETRLSSAMNVPAIVIGFSAGLARSTFANYEEARKSLKVETIEPLLAQMSDTFSRGLGEEVRFALDQIEPVEEEEDADSEAEA